MKLLSSGEYVRDLQNEFQDLPRSVNVICFRIVDDVMVQELKPSLLSALASGTHVTIFADAMFSKHHLLNSFFKGITPRQRKVQATLRYKNLLFFNELKIHGAEITFVNEPGFINREIVSVVKRDHRKVIVLERSNGMKIAYFGGTNLDEGEHNDCMVKVSHPSIVAQIEKSCAYVDKNLPPNDLVLDTGANCIVLLDRGTHFKSTIYQEGIKMIKKAEERVVFVSQLPPEPSLMNHFVHAAKRGVLVEVVLPSASFETIAKFPYSIAFKYAKARAEKHGIKISHCSKGFTHAKILLTDSSVLIGSHNLSSAGVAAGTIELSCEISDPHLIKQVENFVDSIR